jgi:hypothetical protein
MFAALVVLTSLIAGCTRSTGPSALGTLGPGVEELALMRLRSDVEATSCRRWFLGVPLDRDAGDPIAPMVTELLSRDAEATVLGEADVRWEHLSLGLFERQCVTVRGVLGRPIRTITIPGAGAHDHHGHEH